ncbi:MAG TPA: hypothetical protein PLI59_09150 [Candidatus Obscuribacter sp.]|nr:hypothetical protein [Candidatus Melainabacteria bacterium]HNG19333.1 hypothetical protein [Candidatus Obscuribacter sp.]HNG74851.1 hypothetical protein [Candidatus Obscuribacter sp.]
MRMGYTALKVSEASRATLLARFTPRFANVVCHHITLAFKVSEDTPLPAPKLIRVVGYATDDVGVECLVVEVDGCTARPSGGTFHVTLSLAEGRKPVESNKVLDSGFTLVTEPLTIEAPAEFIPFGK